MLQPLAQRVQELNRYRSDFFGRLREILGNRADIRIVGDRFVFQSEVFFDPGSAELKESASPELDKLAAASTGSGSWSRRGAAARRCPTTRQTRWCGSRSSSPA